VSHTRSRKFTPSRPSLLPALLILLFAAHAQARGQEFNYDAYEPRTLAEMIKKYDDPELLEGKFKEVNVIFGGSFPSQVKVVYTGTSRKIPAGRREFIGDWGKTHALSPEIVELFETELLFREGSAEHWLPVQKQVIPYFEKELKKGDTVALYAIIAGGKRISGKWDWVVLVNEFEKQ
jgi:hypothetical protein